MGIWGLNLAPSSLSVGEQGRLKESYRFNHDSLRQPGPGVSSPAVSWLHGNSLLGTKGLSLSFLLHSLVIRGLLQAAGH